MRLFVRLFQACIAVICILPVNSYAEMTSLINFSNIRLGSTGQCPFTVTGGPQLTKMLVIQLYNDNTPGCTVTAGTINLGTSTNLPISLPSGTWSFSPDQRGQDIMCNQFPPAQSFTINQKNSSGTIVSTSSCFKFTCSSNLITCTQTGTLVLVDAS